MRKATKTIVIIGLVLALVLGLATTVFAAGSTESIVDITDVTDESGTKDPYSASDVTPSPELDGYTPLTIPIAARVTGKPESDFDAVLWEQNLTADKTPATFTFSVNIPSGTPVYVFHWNASAKDWEFISQGTAPTVTATFPTLSPVGLVSGKTQTTPVGPTPETPDNPAPQTGDTSNLGLWTAILAVAALGAVGTVIYGKKREKRS